MVDAAGRNNFKRGWALSRQSWRVLRGHGKLVLFPLYGAICMLVVVAPLAGPGAWLADRGDTVPGVALIAAGIYLAAFITSFFGVALAATADRALRGEEAGFGISMLIGSALRQVFAVALYRFALDGEAIGGFAQTDLLGAVHSR